MEPNIDPDRLQAWAMFLRVHSNVARLLEAELEQQRGLPLTSYEVLLRLHNAPQPWRMHELADSLLLSRSGATRHVGKLEKEGLVTREICHGDRRGIQVAVTAKGKRTLRTAAPVHLQGIKDHFTQHLTKTETKHLASAFTKIINATESDHRGDPQPGRQVS